MTAKRRRLASTATPGADCRLTEAEIEKLRSLEGTR